MIDWLWVGGVTATTAQVKAKVSGSAARLAVTTDPYIQPANCTYTTGAIANGVATFDVSGLTADTAYCYAVEVDGNLQLEDRGKFRTAPTTATSFSFVFGSCAGGSDATEVQSNHAAFDAMRALSPAFLLHLGDLHYEDPQTTDPAEWRAIYGRTLASNRQSQLYRDVPIIYVPDNHDHYWAWWDLSDVAAVEGRQACRDAYAANAPHHTLTGSGALYQAFTWGRCRFLVTDTMTERTKYQATDDASKTMLGTAQKAWLKAEMLAATGPIFWVMPATPWIGGGPEDIVNDRWSVYTTERAEMASFIVDNDLSDRVCILSGDAHMLTYDDGTNAPGGVNVLQAAPFDRGGNVLGGPYSQGTPSALRGQFGQVTVTDSGGATVSVTFSGRRVYAQDSQHTTQLMSHTFTLGIA